MSTGDQYNGPIISDLSFPQGFHGKYVKASVVSAVSAELDKDRIKEREWKKEDNETAS